MSLEKEEAIIKVSEEKECNYVSLGKKVLVNLTEDTAKKEHVLKGYTFHESNGKVEEGTYEPLLQDKEIELTENETTTISADDGFEGLRELQITTNVQPVLIAKEFRENGTYYAQADGAQGYSSIKVNVEGSEPVEKLPVDYFVIYDGVIQYLSNKGQQAFRDGSIIELNIPDTYDKEPDTEEELTFTSWQSFNNWYNSFYPNLQEPVVQYEYNGETYRITSYYDYRDQQSQIQNIISSEGSITITAIYIGAPIEGDTYRITGISNNIFSGSFYNNILSIDLPKYVESIGDNNFRQLSRLIKISEIPATCTEIGHGFLEQSTRNLRRIKVNVNNPRYDSREDCGALIETDTNTLIRASKATTFIPDDIEYIGDYAFYLQTLSEITIPESVQRIDMGAFQNCTNLASFTFPENVSELNSNVLANCNSLTEVSFSSNIESVGYSCFANTNLTDIYYGGTLAQFENIKASIKSDAGITGTITVHCIDGDTIVDDSVGEIVFTFQGGTTERVRVNQEVNSVIFSSLQGNIGSIISIEIPEDVKIIDGTTFDPLRQYNNQIITTISLPSTLQSISQYTFQNLSSLTSLGNNNKLPNVYMIGEYAFDGCSSLGNITLPSTVNSLHSWDSQYAFGNMGNLQLTIKNRDQVLNVSPEVFANTNLTAIYVPSNLVSEYQSAEFWSEYASIIYADPTQVNITNVALHNTYTNEYSYFDGSGDYYSLSNIHMEHAYELVFELSNNTTKRGMMSQVYGYGFPDGGESSFEQYAQVNSDQISILQPFNCNISLSGVSADAINDENWNEAGTMELTYQEPAPAYEVWLVDITRGTIHYLQYNGGTFTLEGRKMSADRTYMIRVQGNGWTVEGIPTNYTTKDFPEDVSNYLTVNATGSGGYLTVTTTFMANIYATAPTQEDVDSRGIDAFDLDIIFQ